MCKCVIGILAFTVISLFVSKYIFAILTLLNPSCFYAMFMNESRQYNWYYDINYPLKYMYHSPICDFLLIFIWFDVNYFLMLFTTLTR